MPNKTLVVVGCDTAAALARQQYPGCDVAVAMRPVKPVKGGYDRFVMLWSPDDRNGLDWIEDTLWWRGTAPEWVWVCQAADRTPFTGWEAWA